MPKNKKDESSDSDSGPEDRNPKKKSKSGGGGGGSGDGDEEDSWTIGKNRFIKVREFKGKYYVDIREFYDAGGELKPGKKGISLTMDQWQSLKGHIDKVDAAIKRRV